jgi:branched-chain amino acid aminotransferase
MSLKVYINGQYFDKEQATISVFDHGLLYGDGIFEGMRSYGGKVFRLDQHLKRLWDSAKAIWLEIPMPGRPGPRGQRHARAQRHPGRLRPAAGHAGPARSGSTPTSVPTPQVIIITDHIALYPGRVLRQGTGDRHGQHAAQSPRGAQSPHQVAELPEQHPGQDRGDAGRVRRGPDAQPQGEVAECTGDNIFLVARGRLLTPPTDAGILEGITRDAVMELAREAGITVREIALTGTTCMWRTSAS